VSTAGAGLGRDDVLTLALGVAIVVGVVLVVSRWFGNDGPDGLHALYRDLRARGWPPILAGPASLVLWLGSWL
jgi:hypothetical protein